MIELKEYPKKAVNELMKKTVDLSLSRHGSFWGCLYVRYDSYYNSTHIRNI